MHVAAGNVCAMAASGSTRVVLEIGKKRVFASAIDWPGWVRSARGEAEALDALLDHAPRFAGVVPRSLGFVIPSDVAQLEVIERLPGDGSTEFGVPGAAASVESLPLPDVQLRRALALLEAAWKTFDAAVKAANGTELRKGPRGGGRDLAKIVDHVTDAERAYLAKLGSRTPDDESAAALRKAIGATLTARAGDEPVPNPRNTRSLWSPRYFVRRTAWHALDHAWEIEDRQLRDVSGA
jgi:hypothetical protein